MGTKYIPHIALLLIISALFAFAQFDFKRTNYNINTVEFTSKPLYVSKASLMRHIKPILTENTEGVLHKIEQTLSINPWIEQAEVFTNQKDKKINIQIKERMPALRLYSKKGTSSYIGYDYRVMPLPEGKTPYSSICVHVPEEQLPPKILSDIIEWNQLIISTPSIARHFSYLQYQDHTKIEFIPKEGNPRIILPLQAKKNEIIKNLVYLYDNVLPVIGWHYYQTLNFMYKQQIVATRSKKYKSINPIYEPQ